MSERCHECHGRPSRGSVGLMRLCTECVARKLAWKPGDRRLRREVAFQQADGGQAVWVPDLSRPKGRRS
jgi:hypothetical protein